MKKKILLIIERCLFEKSSSTEKEGKIVLAKKILLSLHRLRSWGYHLVLLLEKPSRRIDYLMELAESEAILITQVIELDRWQKDFMVHFSSYRNLDSANSFLIVDQDFKLEDNPIDRLLGIPKLMLDRLVETSHEEEGRFSGWEGLTDYLLHKDRTFRLRRATKETAIEIRVNLDGKGRGQIKTGLDFFDHMLDNFSKHSKIDLNLKVQGDLEVDEHHTIEDTAIVLATAFKEAWSNKQGIMRYGFVLPMDDSEAHCSIDLSGRGHLEWQAEFKREYVGDFPTELLQHFYYSFCVNAGVNMNMKITGKNEHHKIESSFKAFAKCMKQALYREGTELPSTKGVL